LSEIKYCGPTGFKCPGFERIPGYIFNGVDMVEQLDEYKNDCQSLGYDDHTIQSYCSNLRLFFEYIHLPPNEITNTHLDKFLRYLRHEKVIIRGTKTKTGASKSTINSYFSSLHSYYDYLEFSDQIENNPIPKFRRRYLRHIKKDTGPENTRQIITIQQMAELVYTTEDPMIKAIIMVLAKTGVRRGELIAMDLEDMDMAKGVIYLKPTAKRSNRFVFIDPETIEALEAYLENRINPSPALFVSNTQRGVYRVSRNYVYRSVCENALRLGLHDPDKLLIDKFTPHCCRHWFTTHLSRAGMSRQHLQALRGDVVKDAVDIYDHIDLDGLRGDYLDKIPQLKLARVCPLASSDL